MLTNDHKYYVKVTLQDIMGKLEICNDILLPYPDDNHLIKLAIKALSPLRDKLNKK